MVEAITFQTIFQFLQTISIMVGIAYYLMILQNQQINQELTLRTLQTTLETRQAQMFMNIYSQTNSIDFIKARTRLLKLKYCNFQEFIKLMDFEAGPENEENYNAMDFMINYYEGIGVLVREGLIPIRYIALLMAGITRRIWEKIGPVIEETREYTEQPRIASEWEYLYNELMKYMEEHPKLAT